MFAYFVRELESYLQGFGVSIGNTTVLLFSLRIFHIIYLLRMSKYSVRQISSFLLLN